MSRRKKIFRRIKVESKYLADPLLVFGVFWSSVSIFNLLNGWSDFDLGRYFILLLKEYRELTEWFVNSILVPFEVEVPQIFADSFATWVILAGTTARAQQIKFIRNLDELKEIRDLNRWDRWNAKKNSILSLPFNLICWPLVLYLELCGINAPPHLFNLKGLYAQLFGEGYDPRVRKRIFLATRIIFAMQWLYIIASLLVLFMLNTLDVYFNKPDII